MCGTYTFILPLYVTLPRKTKEDRQISLNMNVYRNLHHSINSDIKRRFEPIHCELWEGEAKKIIVTYEVRKKFNRLFDTMNFVAVADKFFLDWLQKKGLLSDDNCNIVSYREITGSCGWDSNQLVATVEVIE
jgi:hypothetical protein